MSLGIQWDRVNLDFFDERKEHKFKLIEELSLALDVNLDYFSILFKKDGKWKLCTDSQFDYELDYFICKKRHTTAIIAGLNGTPLEYYFHLSCNPQWLDYHISQFKMAAVCEIPEKHDYRIKP